MSRDKLLFISQCLPYPPHSGVTNRTFNIIRQLSKGYDVSLFAFSRQNHQKDLVEISRAREVLSSYGVAVGAAVRIESEQSTLRRSYSHLSSFVSGHPYTFGEYRSAELENALQRELSTSPPAIVHIDSLDLYRWVDLLPQDLPVTCTHHSIESDLLRLRAKHIHSPWLRRYLNIQAGRVEDVERRYCPSFDLNVMMSDIDGERLRRLAPAARTLTIANGVDVQHMQPIPSRGVAGRVVFLGPSYMFPNKDAIDFMIEQIWRAVVNANPHAEFEIVGKVASEEALAYERHQAVRCAGFVTDIRPTLAAATCCVAPLRVGGGTRLKILDYWAMGKAVVATSIGCEGLETVDGENILIRDDPASFADAVTEVLNNPSLRARLESGARETAVRRYSWDVIGATLREAYATLSSSPTALRS